MFRKKVSYYDLVKSRHSGENRVQRIYDYLKKLDSGSPLSLGRASPEWQKRILRLLTNSSVMTNSILQPSKIDLQK